MDLPDNIIEIELLRINRDNRKICECEERSFIVDTTNKSIHCSKCGIRVEAYEALYELALNCERLNNQANNLLKQKKELSNYKPYLIVIRTLEKKYRGRKKLPRCPICGEGFYLEEITSWINKEFVDKKRQETK
ncbi:hypothetical protein [Clostridioides difficile]|uniref:hypothetical protein n=1 Tax=Clostridioides difficile TaxID=1496 RepID=UPI001034B1CF|nr:hypothetical protein [Clostridioides difficile]MDM9944044.1 hypothetical protein [Clostridioides difficile]